MAHIPKVHITPAYQIQSKNSVLIDNEPEELLEENESQKNIEF